MEHWSRKVACGRRHVLGSVPVSADAVACRRDGLQPRERRGSVGASEWMYCLTRAAPVSAAECVSSAPACVASVTSTPALAWLLRHHGCGRLHQECEHYTSWPVPAGTSVFALHRSVCGTQLHAGEHQCNPSGGCSATCCCDLISLGPRYRLGAPLTRMSVSLAPEMSNIGGPGRVRCWHTATGSCTSEMGCS